MLSLKKDVRSFLARVPPFASASPADLEALAQATSVFTFGRRAVIFNEGDCAASGWVVQSGRVRILSFSTASRSVQVESLGSGQLFGLLCRLGSRTDRYMCTAVADGPVVALRLPDTAFLSAYRRSADVARATCGLCARRLSGMRVLVGLGRRDAQARLAALLLGLRREFGDSIPATRHSLAQWVGAAQETVFRVLARWRRRGILKTGRGVVVILDATALEAAAVEDS